MLADYLQLIIYHVVQLLFYCRWIRYIIYWLTKEKRRNNNFCCCFEEKLEIVSTWSIWTRRANFNFFDSLDLLCVFVNLCRIFCFFAGGTVCAFASCVSVVIHLLHCFVFFVLDSFLLKQNDLLNFAGFTSTELFLESFCIICKQKFIICTRNQREYKISQEASFLEVLKIRTFKVRLS